MNDKTEKPKPEVKEPPTNELLRADPMDEQPHPDHPGLTRGQVKQAQAKARKKLEAARVKAAMERAESEELKRLEQEEGLVVGGIMGEMVTIQLNLAPHTLWLSTNGKRFSHGGTYTVTRSVAADLLYRQYKGWEAESARLGEDRFAFYQRPQNIVISKTGIKSDTGHIPGVFN